MYVWLSFNRIITDFCGMNREVGSFWMRNVPNIYIMRELWVNIFYPAFPFPFFYSNDETFTMKLWGEATSIGEAFNIVRNKWFHLNSGIVQFSKGDFYSTVSLRADFPYNHCLIPTILPVAYPTYIALSKYICTENIHLSPTPPHIPPWRREKIHDWICHPGPDRCLWLELCVLLMTFLDWHDLWPLRAFLAQWWVLTCPSLLCLPPEDSASMA